MPWSTNKALGILFALSTLVLGACSAPKMLADPEKPYPQTTEPSVGQVLHLPTGVFVEEPQMLQAVADARIVYVGETHDNPAAHRLQLAVLRTLAERYPGQVALGMEMFTPSQQPALDRWVAGELSEKEFLKTSRWYQVWRMDFDLYRPLLDFARQQQIPVIGLNAEKALVRKVAQSDLAELAESDQANLPQMDMTDPYQRALVEAIFGGHSQGSSQLDGFVRAQTLWDETMAANVAAYLGAQGREQVRMLVVAGGNHIRFGFGIPRRVFRRLPSSYALVGSTEIVIPENKKDRLMDVEMPKFPMPPYDYLTFTEYEDLGKQEVKLGVLLDDTGGRVGITGVLPGSNAERAGLQKDDILVRFDSTPLQENFDLVYEVKQKKPGDQARLEVDRQGESLQITIEFAPQAPGVHGMGAHPPKD